MDELLDIYDEHDQPLNQTALKSVCQTQGLWRRVAFVWVFNRKNDVLLQLRAKTKKVLPGCWDVSSAGHVLAGELVEQAAIRELEEELGLQATTDDLQFIRTLKVDFSFKDILLRQHNYHYAIYTDMLPEDMSFEPAEVEDAKFFPVQDIRSLRLAGPASVWDQEIEVVKEFLGS